MAKRISVFAPPAQTQARIELVREPHLLRLVAVEVIGRAVEVDADVIGTRQRRAQREEEEREAH